MISLVLLSLVSLAAAAPGYDFHDLYSPHLIKAAPLVAAPIHLAPAPILKAAPILAPAPVIKTVIPATSYASVTQYHVAHPTVVKTIVAPTPILKSYVASPLSYGHGFH